MSKANPSDLLSQGVHLGHKKNKANPKAQDYIYTTEKGVSIIDLFQTSDRLEEAKKFVADLAKENKTILFVASKKIAREPVRELCEKNDLLHMTNKWVGGFLTNYPEISKNIEKMNEMRTLQDSGEWNTLIKHERIAEEKKLNRISSIYTGVKGMKSLPDALFIIDIKKEKNALEEAIQLKIPTIALVDTNVNPEDVTFPIPGNDDAITSIKYITEQIVQSYVGNTQPDDVKTTEKAKKPSAVKKTEKTKASKSSKKTT